YIGDQPNVSNPESYGFPALTARGGIDNLISYSLGQFQATVGLSNTLSRNRLIFTAHSGGGEALMRILPQMPPDEVQVFDALYWDVSPLISWVNSRIAAEIAAWTPGKTHADGG